MCVAAREAFKPHLDDAVECLFFRLFAAPQKTAVTRHATVVAVLHRPGRNSRVKG
jgi:hypothetical protein